ncbi:uncharacterized protein LOC117601106 isoform X2 [Osmia lignaria lignaria]|uniref:uncharacterized protein LOC117601106 isoform X2 n=1 Tax=Osmia lignaria lignaria TaxID=1437193 RepID=UPI001478EFF7|nr:uncharacterized protein LOC117601106 isoform X2 [Osmia lignaria]
MISSFPSYDEELLNSAYANISLIADKAWTFDKEDPFQKLNQSLWIQYHKVSVKYKENVDYRAKRVRDVIPESRLAIYGNYEYNEEREATYKPEDGKGSTPLRNFCWTEVSESWMLPDVEKYFSWLTSHRSRSNHELLVCHINFYNNVYPIEIAKLTLPSSKIRTPEVDDASKIASSFKSDWDDLQNKYKLSQESRNASRLSKEIESDAGEKAQHQRYTIENSMEMQLHIRVTSEAVRNLWKLGSNVHRQFVQQRTRLQCYHQSQQPLTNPRENCLGKERPQQFYYTFQYRPLIFRTEYQTARTETYGMSSKHLPPVLSPEVPEFFPKVPPIVRLNKEQNTSRLQYFPSLNERSYQNELFPYNRTHGNIGTVYQNTGIPLLPATDTTTTFIRHPPQWYQRMIPPSSQIHISSSTSPPRMCTSIQPLRATTITHHPLQVQEKFLQPNPIPIPVYQHPIELYHETGQKRKNQGVDFKNLILLTKNAMKAHRGQSKQSHEKPTYVLETRNRSSKTESQMFRWLDKSCSSKTREYGSSNTLVSELSNFDGRNERRRAASSSRREKDGSKNNERLKTEIGIISNQEGSSTTKSNNERDQKEIRNRRRLYRDVLTNASVNQTMFENVFEKRYDELEKQAMEQYRSSEESLALKYQELERQALEQYRCCGNVQDDDSMDSKQINEDSTRNVKDASCFDGQRCSGFGRCSPLNAEEKEERDSFLQSQDNVARTETKREPVNSGRPLYDTSPRSTVLSKSFTAMSEKISYESKNTCKGASGDKTGKHVRTSSKRRLILVSPFEKESEAKLTRTTDLEEFYCIAQGSKNIFGYYNNSKVGQIGAGDENITFIQSPRTEVWLSGFWTT